MNLSMEVGDKEALINLVPKHVASALKVDTDHAPIRSLMEEVTIALETMNKVHIVI